MHFCVSYSLYFFLELLSSTLKLSLAQHLLSFCIFILLCKPVCYIVHMFIFPSTYFLCLVSVCPTFGGSNPGLRAELIHSVNEDLSLICGCAYTIHPSAFASISVSYFQTNKDFWFCFSHCCLSGILDAV